MLLPNLQNQRNIIRHSQQKQIKNVVIGNYYLKQTIGKGSFGQVKRGIHKPTGEQVAIKIINKNKLSQQSCFSIYNEVQIQQKMLHTNIIKIYQIIQSAKNIYVIMEYAKKGQLYQKIIKQGHLNLKLCQKIFTQILSALVYLHQQGIAHRDVKVENIVLDDQMNAKLIDFGFARKYKKEIMMETMCGSLSYLPPQIVKGEEYKGQLVDVWCLGVTLYIMLTGTYPFGEDKDDHVRESITKIKFINKFNFTKEVEEIFQRIFVPSKTRITLLQLSQSSFVLKCQKFIINSINTLKEKIHIDQNILQQIQLSYQIPSSEVRASIQQFKNDSNTSLYYLLMNIKKRNGQISQADLSSPYFSKQLKNNYKLKQLQTIDRKSEQSSYKSKDKQSTIEMSGQKYYRVRRSLQHKNIESEEKCKKPRTNIQFPRLRRNDNQPESPKRIIDAIRKYQGKDQYQL